MQFPSVSRLKSPEDFRARLNELGVELAFDVELQSGDDSPLNQTAVWRSGTNREESPIGNRFCILPMEGWDGTRDGKPSDLTLRRWNKFGDSGAKLIWGGEAVAVRHDGRANPNQLMINNANLSGIEDLRQQLVRTHADRFARTDDLLVGLQLTHSGRFARPNHKATIEPRTIYQHPILDARFNVNSSQAILTDDELKELIDDFIAAAKLASKAGFAFVDIKHCHGYLGHELLSGFDRAGEFGGSFENRTRFLKQIVAGIRASVPDLELGVRLSIFDLTPFEPGPEGTGIPATNGEYRYAFGGDGSGQAIDLDEPARFLAMLTELGIELVCTTAGSPYYNPHIQRPAAFPPSDGYLPPEDPLAGVARQINATRRLKEMNPELLIVGSGYSYLQEWLPHVGQRVIREQSADFIGLGRMVLSYHDLPADVIAGKTMTRKRICRTFSDCTTAPRNGIVSGCYPLDPFYKKRPEFEQLSAAKKSVT